MKIAINKCFGGFGLSPKALKRYAQLKGKECYFFEHDYKTNCFRAISQETENNNSLFLAAFSVQNPNEILSQFKKWEKLSEKEKMEYNELYKSISISDMHIERDDPDLIKVIEELGDEASGNCANLSIVEIPDDVNWEISEYDGQEYIREKGRSWG